MFKSVSVLSFVLFVSPPLYAEVFKCVGKNGEVLYQNFPCQFESISWVAKDVPELKKSSTNEEKPNEAAAAPAKPRVGMTADEVKTIWGEPTEIIQEEPGEGSRFEVWSYGSGTVRFDRKRRVAAVQ